MIEDEELREVYEISGKEHLQNLEALLLELEKKPDSEVVLQTLLREAHSLKGDSRVTGVRSVEMLSHKLEEILGSIKSQDITLTPAISDSLYRTVDAMRKLVHEAVTDEPSGVDVEQLLAHLSPKPQEQAPIPHTNGNGNGNGSKNSNNWFIQDEDLRDIYKLSSEEHLSKLKAGLQVLEKHPFDENSIEALLQEAQSFELDSRIVGRQDLESLIHKVEEVLERVKGHEIAFTAASNRLNQGLEAIALLVKEAVTGEPSGIDPNGIVQLLSALLTPGKKPQPSPPASKPPQQKAAPAPEVESLQAVQGITVPSEPYRIDTLRVNVRHLDSLMTQAGELTVTKTRLAHASEEIRELTTLWEEWKPRLGQRERHKWGGRLQSSWERLDGIINHLSAIAPENQTRLDLISRELDDRVRTLRLLPLSTVFNLFPRFVRDLGKEQGKQVELVIEGGDIQVDKQILEEIKDPLLHLLRNAIDHGIETPEERQQMAKPLLGKIWLRGYRRGSNIVIEVADDGRGLDVEEIKQTAIKRKLYRPEELANLTPTQLKYLIFTPGFSTRTFITEISGRGVGLDVVRTNVERLKGNIQLESIPDHGCTFRMQMRSSVATLQVMLVTVNGIIHAIPLEFVRQTLLVSPEDIYTLEGRPTISLKDEAISVAKMGEVLELPEVISGISAKKRSLKKERFISLVVLKVESDQLALIIDDLLEVLDVVIKPQSDILKRVRNIIGATILGTGDVCMIINPPDILKSVAKSDIAVVESETEKEAESVVKPVILLTEDSIAVRTQEKRILEKAGYEVVVAVDGMDGYNKLRTRDFDAVISDVQMPNMDGLEFVAKIRQHPEYRELPVILVTSLASEDDKRRGASAGANAYIVKDQFNQEMLLETLERLV
ncbi:hybrid sensor histidine kinase/response regulator [Gloeothece verrucosa]|uniref:histidine kinase n=1 Tax=Gloeothece verrucosa (strain PCC 7822) TaxID=497965 RepID=E0UB18_GLOV7|nr:hybrid sensor histidine kinase/response regulator [Gloeothece verrucosa]ADN16263.1 CheA signal transduction histidine kinase [Gloeothece verrucosa PCC 7822]